jgi:hypothetical protein
MQSLAEKRDWSGHHIKIIQPKTRLDDDWLVTLLNRPIKEDEFILFPYLETRN